MAATKEDTFSYEFVFPNINMIVEIHGNKAKIKRCSIFKKLPDNYTFTQCESLPNAPVLEAEGEI